jgi:hypothetical protein
MMVGFLFHLLFPDQVHENELSSSIVSPVASLDILGWLYVWFAIAIGGKCPAAS